MRRAAAITAALLLAAGSPCAAPADAPAPGGAVVLYSSADLCLATLAHRILQAAGPAFIAPTLPAGVRWRPDIARRIAAADLVVVVWSAHAAASAELQRELGLVELNPAARLAPVIADNTALHALLMPWQWVDARHITCNPKGAPAP